MHTLKVPTDFLHVSYEIFRCCVFDQGYTVHIKYHGTKRGGKYVKQASNGSFNKYVDQILTTYLPRVDTCGHFIYYIPNLSSIHVTKRGLCTGHLPSSFCPRSY